MGDKVSKIGKNLTKSVNQAGKITLSTKAKTTALSASSSVKNTIKKKQPTNSPRQHAAKMQVAKKTMSRAARLDDELINTHVDPVLIRRTVRQSVRERSRSPLAQPHYRERSRYRSRSRSPILSSRDYDRPRYHYDDPRREAREEEILRQRIRDEDRRRQMEPPSYHLTNS